MKIFIITEQKVELERFHDSHRDRCVRDRIKAIPLTSEGWNSAMIAQVLRLHETTINRPIHDYLNGRKLKPKNGGSDGMLSVEQTEQLTSYLCYHLFHHPHEIVAYLAQRWFIQFSIPAMNKWLHRQGFTYKKPSGIPHKFSEKKQAQYIKYYEDMMILAGNESVLFLDTVHPTQATKISYRWIRKGYKKSVKTTGGRTRLNILGALNLNDIGRPIIHDYKIIDDYNVAIFFNEICQYCPNYRQKIHLIMDGTGYNRTELIKDWAKLVNIELHYLPPYSPNLSAIERLWKVMNEHAKNNRYLEKTRDFRDAIFNFFTTTLAEIVDTLSSRTNDNFQVFRPAS